MKVFESFLSQQMEAFISYRKNLGYRVIDTRSQLLVLDRYICRQPNPTDVWHPAFYLKIRKDLKLEPTSANLFLYTARCFFQYLVRTGQCRNNPVQDVPALHLRAFIPYIFSPEQVEELLNTLCNQIRRNRRFFLKDFGEYLVILLLARCGLRITEPLQLKIQHYRTDEKTIYIEKTKFKKDRLIPIPNTVADEMDNYLAARAALAQDCESVYLFIGFKQKALYDQRIRTVFHKAVKRIGIDSPRRIIGNTTFGNPTPHSLRHSFAVNTLKVAIARGQTAQNVLPTLAAYMGHVEYRHTIKYLKVADAESGVRLLNFAGTQREEL